MSGVDRAAWTGANQRYLMARIDIVRQHLTRLTARDRAESYENAVRQTERAARDAALAMPAPAALDVLCALFSLSSFERDLLLLCAGVELDGAFASACAVENDGGRALPTFSMALATMPNGHWSAITPAGPLRYWRLIEIGPGDLLTTSALRIDERVLHYLAGVSYRDERLSGRLVDAPGPTELPESQQTVARRISALWSVESPDAPPLVHLGGDDGQGALAVASVACAAVGLELQVMSAASVPADPTERDLVARVWEREALLMHSALVIEGDDADLPFPAQSLAENVRSHVLLTRCKPPMRSTRRIVQLEVSRPTSQEQWGLWRETLGSAVPSLNGSLDRLVSQFDLTAAAIGSVGAQMRAHPADDPPARATRLWDACRLASRGRLDYLAQRIETIATWADLVLPQAQLQILRDMASQVRQRRRVYDTWGLASSGARGLGISALFAGPSGTGKTMAAEVLADDLRLDLYRIDLSQVVSKYIGETEKNLRRVFDAAEGGGAVLLFDEADALFGKRSDVKDSHDRYANIEISYLLQRMESYRGLAILTTNMKNALDEAFLRRLRFIVQFPFPDAAHRAEIWRRAYPVQTPVVGLDFSRLARLNVAGGHIRNIALHAAFFAAAEEEPVSMAHLLRAARCEFAKLERQLTDAEVAGWS
jgi:hypothetical protein